MRILKDITKLGRESIFLAVKNGRVVYCYNDEPLPDTKYNRENKRSKNFFKSNKRGKKITSELDYKVEYKDIVELLSNSLDIEEDLKPTELDLVSYINKLSNKKRFLKVK